MENEGRHQLLLFNAPHCNRTTTRNVPAGRCKRPETDTALLKNMALVAVRLKQTGFHHRAETHSRTRRVVAGQHFSFTRGLTFKTKLFKP